jgi:thymidylate kinase
MVGRGTRAASVIALEGPSGAGKTSVAARLAPLLGGTAVAEAYDRLGRSVPLAFHGRDELSDLERTLLREEGRRWTEAVELRTRGSTAVLDTATFGPLTYAWGLREGVDGGLDVVLELVRTVRRMAIGGRWGIPDLTVYLRTEPQLLEKRRAKRAAEGDAYARTITVEYLREIHQGYERLAVNWRETLRKYQEYAIVPSDADIVIFDPEAKEVLSAHTHHMRVDYSMFEGIHVTGVTKTVLSRGFSTCGSTSFFPLPRASWNKTYSTFNTSM